MSVLEAIYYTLVTYTVCLMFILHYSASLSRTHDRTVQRLKSVDIILTSKRKTTKKKLLDKPKIFFDVKEVDKDATGQQKYEDENKKHEE